MNVRHVIWASIVSTTISCQSVKKEYNSFDEYPVREDALTEMEYSPAETKFSLWAPTAEEVRVLLFESGNEGSASNTFPMEMGENGTWNISIKEDLKGKFYTFNVKVNGKWLGDTPGIMAKAVGVNGKRAAVLDLRSTDPEEWENDVRPPLKNYADITVYEMHHRDFSLDSVSGIQNKGKFLALTEQGTTSSSGEKTGIDHLKELGITHVHLLPSYDYASVDETKLDKAQYNWGYDPQNYNVPDGSYSTDPYKPDVRIREFKQMVQALHKAGIRVVLDVVYNHTFNTDESNFERTVPGYFYRQTKDGQWANGSGCGNETASDRAMMRKYMIESILYWINEYHIDGFRFDLMGIHDIETMNEIRAAIDKIDPSIFMYGEGWAASSPQLEADRLAMKANVEKMPRIAAFSDEMRDGLRGGWDDDTKGAFLVGEPGHEMSIKFGIVGAIEHPQVISDSVNYSKKPWALQPTQMISYVSCHDDMCLADRLKATMPDASVEELAALQKLAETFVFTSQGVPFIFACVGRETDDFKLKTEIWLDVVKATIYADLLIRLSNRTRPYEKVAGSVDVLYNKWRKIFMDEITNGNYIKFSNNIKKAVKEFDEIALNEDAIKPKVGIVGEILVKYHPTANNHVEKILFDEGAEVVTPDLMDFFMYMAYDDIVKYKMLDGKWIDKAKSEIFIKVLEFFRKPMCKALRASKRFTAPYTIKEIAKLTTPHVSLGNMAGEGWFLTGEMAKLIQEGVDNIICLQPFGCLPNHITGKGMIRELMRTHDGVNIVAIDCDAGISEVNQLNRIKLMLSVAKEKIAEQDHKAL